jgi:hypothetical protein
MTPSNGGVSESEVIELSSRADWYRIRSKRDQYSSRQMGQFGITEPVLIGVGYSPGAHEPVVAPNPSGLNDIELAYEFIKVARRVGSATPRSSQSHRLCDGSNGSIRHDAIRSPSLSTRKT